jgi:predicted ester cyclase
MSDRNKAIVRGYMKDLINSRDWSKWERYFSEGLSFNGSPFSQAGMQQMMNMFLAGLPDLTLAIEDQITEGDKVATRVTFRGSHRGEMMGIGPTGRRVAFQGLAMDRIEGERVVEMWHEVDMWGLAQQLRGGA